MGCFTSVYHPTQGEIQFKHGDDFQARAELGQAFQSIRGPLFREDCGLPPNGIYWGISGGMEIPYKTWLVVVKDNAAVEVQVSAADGLVRWPEDGEADDLPAHQEQVAALVERWGVQWQG
jgi:hypothetical protein